MRRPALILAAAAIPAILLTGCGGGLFGRSTPDEYAVARQAPLVVPPDFALTPPAQGAPRSADELQQKALEALFGGTAPRSEAESNVIGRAGGDRSDPAIRSTLADPETFAVAKGPVTQTILSAPEGDGQEAQAAIPGG